MAKPLVLSLTLAASLAGAAEPMNENDLGSVAFSNKQNILNVMGASAAGEDAEVYIDMEAESDHGTLSGSVKQSVEKTQESVAATVRTDLKTEGREALSEQTVGDAINAVANIARTNGSGTNIQFQYDPKKHNASSTATPNSLNISHDVSIDRLQIEGLVDRSGATLGMQQFKEINVFSNVVIRGAE